MSEINIVIAVITILMGGGGLGALYAARVNAKRFRSQSETEGRAGVTAEFEADPKWKEPVLAPADISGMLSVDGNRYQRRVVVQTVPGQQWGVERELRARIRAGFSDAHLAFALPRFVEAGK